MKSAAQTLAASMASSISRCASVRVRGTIFSMRPLSSQTICVSVVSKSTAPRVRRCLPAARGRPRAGAAGAAPERRGAGPRARACCQDRGHFGVGQPRMRPHHRRGRTGRRRSPRRCRHEHVADHAQALDLGIERTQAVGQLLRQHRDHAAREVHRGRALVGVVVQRLARLDVVADVGDRHQQAPTLEGRLPTAALERLAVDGIVEVARVLAVDGDQRHVRQVDPPTAVDRAQALGQRGGLRQTSLARSVRHLVLAHRDLDLHAGVVDLAQHLDHAARPAASAATGGSVSSMDTTWPAGHWQWRSWGSGCPGRNAGLPAPRATAASRAAGAR
jgi:hypothetical protein